jgi:hypothetical protein
MKDFSQSLFASNLFVSNFLFFHEVDYFETQSNLKPLLHTWSLGVEMQFYLTWPLLLFLMKARLKNTTTKDYFLFVGALSFFLSLIFSFSYSMHTFYLLPFRIWEFIIGAYVAQSEISDRNSLGNSKVRSVKYQKYAIQFFVIFVMSLLWFLPQNLLNQLCLKTGRHFTIVKKVLSLKLLTLIGKLSYGIYLFHYPIINFAPRIYPDLNRVTEVILVILTTLCLAIFSKFVIEDRLKVNIKMQDIRFIKLSSAITFISCSLAIFGHFTNGFERTHTKPPVEKFPLIFNTDLTIIGDSHLGEIYDVLSKTNAGISRNFTRGGCIPLRGINQFSSYSPPGECYKWVNESFDKIYENRGSGLILISSMSTVYLTGNPFKGQLESRTEGLVIQWKSDSSLQNAWSVYELGLKKTFNELSDLEGKDVIFALDYPELGIENGCQNHNKKFILGFIRLSDLVKSTPQELCRSLQFEFESRNSRVLGIVDEISKSFPNIRIYNPAEDFCDEKYCYGYREEYGLLYSDADHLSESGSLFYLSNFSRFLERNRLSYHLFSDS